MSGPVGALFLLSRGGDDEEEEGDHEHSLSETPFNEISPTGLHHTLRHVPLSTGEKFLFISSYNVERE